MNEDKEGRLINSADDAKLANILNDRCKIQNILTAYSNQNYRGPKLPGENLIEIDVKSCVQGLFFFFFFNSQMKEVKVLVLLETSI